MNRSQEHNTLPQGFQSAGLFCGIKSDPLKKDLGLIYSAQPCQWAGTFTQNTVKAFCVQDNADLLRRGGRVQAILANSGNANACSGPEGQQTLQTIKRETAQHLGISEEALLTASTGIIGVPLASAPIVEALPGLKSKLSDDPHSFAEAILTTDTTIKISQRQLGQRSSLMGITKGAGMIHPNMATMLAFLLTDASIEATPAELNHTLGAVVARTFNQISVDGDTSTNDMVLCLANGLSGEKLSLSELEPELEAVCEELAIQIVRDGEGAQKVLEVKVLGASSLQEARSIAKGMISSALVKAALHSGDPNWGRLLAAAGQHGKVIVDSLTLQIQGQVVFRRGSPGTYDREALHRQLQENQLIRVELDLGQSGDHSAKAWGCDLSAEYVQINAEYST